MKALVLAAGHGERLRPLTEETPKPLLEVGGRPLIHYPLLMLNHAGIKLVAVNVHHLAGHLEATLGNGGALGVNITYAPEPVLSGTGGPLCTLRAFFGGEPFFVLNSDTIMDLDLMEMLAFHRERAALATLAVYRPQDLSAYSRVEIDGGGRICRMRLLWSRDPIEFSDYPLDLEAGIAAGLAGCMYAGVLICEPAVFDLAPKSPPWSLMADLFAPMVTGGLPVFGYRHHGYFGTVDDLESYRTLTEEFATSPPLLPYLSARLSPA